jgi:hypothetical protein
VANRSNLRVPMLAFDDDEAVATFNVDSITNVCVV